MIDDQIGHTVTRQRHRRARTAIRRFVFVAEEEHTDSRITHTLDDLIEQEFVVGVVRVLVISACGAPATTGRYDQHYAIQGKVRYCRQKQAVPATPGLSADI